jgi:hypothetical protein
MRMDLGSHATCNGYDTLPVIIVERIDNLASWALPSSAAGKHGMAAAKEYLMKPPSHPVLNSMAGAFI